MHSGLTLQALMSICIGTTLNPTGSLVRLGVEESPELGWLNLARRPEPDRVNPVQNNRGLNAGKGGVDQRLQKVRLGPACLRGVLNQPSSDLVFLVEAPPAIDLVDGLQEVLFAIRAFSDARPGFSDHANG